MALIALFTKIKKISSTVLLTCLLFLALVLRVPLLDGSFWLDEAAQALESDRPFSEQLSIRDDFQPPLLHLLLHFSLVVSSSEEWLRFVGAVLPGLVTIYFSYKIAETVFDKKTAVLSSLLLITSSFHIFYSQELRQYSLPAAFAAASWYILVEIFCKSKKTSIKDLTFYSLLTAGGLYSSYLYPFLLLSQILWLLFTQKNKIVPWIISLIGSAVLFLPWLPSFLDQLEAGTILQAELPGWGRVVSPTQLRAIPLVVLKFTYGVLDVEPTLFFIATSVALLMLFSALVYYFRHALLKYLNKSSAIVFWLLVPLIFSWIVSFWVPVLQPKRILFSLPAWYLFLSSFLYFSEELKFKSTKIITSLIIALLLSINIFSTVSYWFTPALQRENWRELISEIETKFDSNSLVVFSFPKPFAPWYWYADDSYPVLATGKLLTDQESSREFLKNALDYDHVLLFDYLRDLTDPNKTLDQTLLEYGYIQTGVLEYPVIGFVRIYSKPEAVISYK